MEVFKQGDLIADRYQVQGVLGQGGMGVVYLVMDQLAQQRLALKTLLPQYVSNERAVQRFVREVKTVRQLDHPCIVKIHDAQKIGNLLYYTMDYVEGKSLHTWIQQRGRLGLGSTVRILSLLSHALEHAHQYTIHRDISPDNVMVLADGNVKLLDFGLAKLTNTDQQFTMFGVSLGKAQYNSPEQRASAADVDLRADIFSLGVMFFEMLSGEIPKLGQKLTETVPGLPKECDAFYTKATASDRNDRFQNANEFRVALGALYEKVAPKGAKAAPQKGAEEQTAGGSVIRRAWSWLRSKLRW